MPITINIEPGCIEPQRKAAIEWLRRCVLDEVLDIDSPHIVTIPSYVEAGPQVFTLPDGETETRNLAIAFHYRDETPSMAFSETFYLDAEGNVYSSEAGWTFVVLNINGSTPSPSA